MTPYKFAIAALSLACSTPAMSATIMRTVDFDLDQALLPSGLIYEVAGPAFSAMTPFDLAAGDTLSLTVDFLGSQQLKIDGPQSFWIHALTNDDPSTVDATGTLSLLDVAGATIATSDIINSVEAYGHFGQFYFSGNFAGLPNSLTIGGLRYEASLLSYDLGITTRSYTFPALWIAGDNISLAQSISPVPEPAIWLELIFGFALMGAIMRKKLAGSIIRATRSA